MTTSIAAKPTVINGVRYRSRLEARWAVFLAVVTFDGCTYEPTATSSISYQPDFEIVTQGDWRAYVEVKPDSWLDKRVEDRERDIKKWMSFVADVQPHPLFFLMVGTPGEWENGKLTEEMPGGYVLITGDFDTRRVAPHPIHHELVRVKWAECPKCHMVDLLPIHRRPRCQCKPEMLQFAMETVRDYNYGD